MTTDAPASSNEPSAGARIERAGLRSRGWFARYRSAVLCGLAMLAIIAGFPAGYIVGNHVLNPALAAPDVASMSQCTGDALKTLELKQPPTVENLRQLVDFCYSLLHGQRMLRDFTIRELNFVQQYRANGVLLWMVVVITLCGVLLAAIQLVASYQLANANKTGIGADSEISLARDRIVLKSSITGLFILLLSFAFFLVFVLYVYRFEIPEAQSKVQPPVPTLPEGGLGPPPKKPESH